MEFDMILGFLAQYGFSLAVAWDFFCFGLMMNVIGYVVMIIGSMIKTFKFDEEENEEYVKFIELRKSYIKKVHTTKRIAADCLTVLFPMYTFIMALVFTWNIAKFAGPLGIMAGAMAMEKIALFPMINYKLVKAEKE
jgi:hypothetical protein